MLLVYVGDEELVVKGYVDASINTDLDDSKSRSGYLFFVLNGATASWGSSKRSIVATSATKAEYVAASKAAQEGVWMKKLVTDLGVVPRALDPMMIYCDNTSAISNPREPRSHKNSKHIKPTVSHFT
jgi:hypothetical protein